MVAGGAQGHRGSARAVKEGFLEKENPHVADIGGKQELAVGLQGAKASYVWGIGGGGPGEQLGLEKAEDIPRQRGQPEQRPGCGTGEFWACLAGDEGK